MALGLLADKNELAAMLAPDAPSLAVDLNNLAETLRLIGELEAAERLYLRAVAIDERARGGGDPGALAWACHDTLARSPAALAGQVCAELGARTVGLSGGVFVNRVLLAATVGHLRALGLEPLTHRQVPANDGGLALGQVAVGVQHLRAAGVPPDPTHRPPH